MKSAVRLALAAVSLSALVACSSSSSGSPVGGSDAATDAHAQSPDAGGSLTCQGSVGASGAGSTACSGCLQTSCGSQLKGAESSCATYVACYEGCQCNDTSCLEGCLSDIDSTCQTPFQNLTTCLTGSCSSQCTTAVDSGVND